MAQLVLPGIAAQQLRDRLSRSGHVLEVKVQAFPAIELLWHQADRVVVRMASYHSTPGHLGSSLAQTSDAGSLYASAQRLRTGRLTLSNATLTKRGNELVGRASVSEANLRSAVPFVQGVTPVASGDGKLVLRGTALGVTADATLMAVNGKLVVQPNVPILNFFTVTVFDDPHVTVQGVAARAIPGGFVLSARGRLK
ncbi:MAG TPA: LmeA family phospholipid-binding protein [Solirubrobacteraceae bacterium]|nr:LmeA family phospholipid-binding protein [Solirubrobacteraceae bacterium]